MKNLLYLYGLLDEIITHSDIISEKYKSNFFKQVLILPEDKLELVVIELLNNIKETNLIKRKLYLKNINTENRFMNEITNK